MKIAIFSDCYLDLTGGIVSSINAQKTALEQLGHTVYIFSTAFPKTKTELEQLKAQNIYVVPSCWLCFRGLTPVSRRPRRIENWLLRTHPELKDFDIFYIHYEAGCSIAGLRLAKKLKIPSVQVMHGREDAGEASIIPKGLRTIVAWFLNHLHACFLPHPTKILRDDYLAKTIATKNMWEIMVNHANAANLVVTPSHHFKKKLQNYGVSRPMTVLPNGYPDEKFLRKVTVKSLEPNQTLKIIWHSRLFGEKRILPFLAALKNVTGKYRLDVYGDGADLGKAQKYAKTHRLNVKFHGNTNFATVQKAIQNSHLDILASYNFDDYPMTLVEAEACGVPVFFCDPDMKEIVPAGSYVLATGPDPEQMATALNRLLEHPEKIAQMSEIMVKHREETLISHRIKPIIATFNRLKH